MGPVKQNGDYDEAGICHPVENPERFLFIVPSLN